MKYIKKLSDGSILLTSQVMIPDVPDCDYLRGEPPLTRQQIRDFKDSYEKYRFVDSEHELVRTGKPCGVKKDSFLLSEDTALELYDGSTQIYPEGTWMMTSHITDPEAITAAENGEYTGYSPSIRSKDTADKYLELITQMSYNEAEALKSQSRSGLIRDVPNPVVLSVSLVKKPCQIGSKICKLQNKGESMSEDTVKAKVLKALGMSEEADVEALKSQVTSLDDKIDDLKEYIDESLKSMKDDFIKALNEFAEDNEDGEEGTPTSGENEETEPPEDDDDEEEEEEDKKTSGSKQGHVHNGADKSQTAIEDTYEFLGRYPDGTRKSYDYK